MCCCEIIWHENQRKEVKMSSVKRTLNEPFVTAPKTPNPGKYLENVVIMALVRKALRNIPVENNKNNFYTALPVITLIAFSWYYFVFREVFPNSPKSLNAV